MAVIKDEAICIRHWDWSETSQTVSLLTREHGIVRGIAKGSKREHSPFSGGIELATRGEVVASIKPSASEASLVLLTAWDLLETFPGASRSLLSYRSAMCVIDLAHHALAERDPHAKVLDALIAAMRELAPPGGELRAVLRFIWALLDEIGHRPEVLRDVRTQALLGSAVLFGFDPRLGGVITDPGDLGVRPSPGQAGAWRVRAETVGVLQSLARLENIDPDRYSDNTVSRAVKLLCFYFRELVGVQPPAMSIFLEALRSDGGESST